MPEEKERLQETQARRDFLKDDMRKWIGIICLIGAIVFASEYMIGRDARSKMTGDTVTKEEAENADTVIFLSQEGTTVKGSGVSIEENTVSIEKAGIYRLTGTLTDGQILVKTEGKASVALVLDTAFIANSQGPAICAEDGGAVTIYLMEGTENRIISGVETDIHADAADENASSGAVYLRGDAVICGEGSLAVYGYINNGIQCSSSLSVKGGSISVAAVNHGIKGKDSLTIDGGIITVLSGGDGLRSDDETGDGYGVIAIHGGLITVESCQDAVQAETCLEVTGGELNVKTRDAGGNMDVWPGSEDVSRKGLKSGNRLTITGGSIVIDTADDALHCNGDMEIAGGALLLSTEDDGIHADSSLIIDDGDMVILTSHEGLESNQVTINGGTISLNASDDGVNACGGSLFPTLTINGGELHVNAHGDGLDSNGDLIINGGTVIIDGPSTGDDGALDYGKENGGRLTVNGGTVLAIGDSHMAEVFQDDSGQCSFSYTLSAGYEAGSTITIVTADGTVLWSHTSVKRGNSVVFSDPALTIGSRYRLTVDGTEYEILLTAMTTSMGKGGQLWQDTAG